jgi:UDP-glucose 4-epimerase
MKNILITGGLGYVGGRIAQQLVTDPDNILYLVTRKEQPDMPASLTDTKRVHTLHTKDVFREEEIFSESFDSIIHLAALNEIDCVKSPADAVDFNVTRSLLLLEKAIRSKVPQFIYFSTAHIYGPLKGNIDETYLPRPVHPYAITHKAMEDFVYAAHISAKIQGISLRLSNSLGAPISPDVNRWTLLVNDLCRQAVGKGELKLQSAGTQKRDFIALSDVARSVMFIMGAEPDRLGDGIFNLGGNCTMSVLEMTHLIQERCAQVLGFEPPIILPEIINPQPAGEPLSFDSGKLAAAGFQWKGNIPEEIDQLLIFCKTHFDK